MVKVIWHKAASSPHMCSSIVFARLRRQCALPSNTCFLGPTRYHTPNGISMGSAVFVQLTAEGPYTLQWTDPSPPQKKCPFPREIWTQSKTWFLGPIWDHKPNGIYIRSSVFAQMIAECPILYNGTPLSPQNCPFPWGDLDPHLIHGPRGPPEPSTQTIEQNAVTRN